MAEALKESGIACEEYYLHGRQIAPCSACDACQRSEEFACSIDDGMTDIYRAVVACECLVLAAPIYNFTVSAQLKLFLDRSYALWKPSGSALTGKKVGIFLTYGDEDPGKSGVNNAIGALRDCYDFVGAEILGICHRSAGAAGAIRNDTAAMDEAYELGRKIAATLGPQA